MQPLDLRWWKNRRVLVTGASGFKGAWLTRVLLELEATVYGTVRDTLDPQSAFSVLGLRDRITEVRLDLCSRSQVREAINNAKPEAIIHLAAKARVPDGLADPWQTFDTNVMGTINVLEACRQLRVCERLLIVSTDHVFGNFRPSVLPEHGFHERSRVSYNTPYDTSKAMMELAARSYIQTYPGELPYVCITRCANAFGFGDRNQRRVIPNFLRLAKEEKAIHLDYRSNGRQFISVSDAVDGYIRALSFLERPSPEPTIKGISGDDQHFAPTFHFAIETYPNTDQPYITLQCLAELMAHLFGATIDDRNARDYAPNENKVQALDCFATRRGLGWEPHTDLYEGIVKLGEWYDLQHTASRREKNHFIDAEVDKVVSHLSVRTRRNRRNPRPIHTTAPESKTTSKVLLTTRSAK